MKIARFRTGRRVAYGVVLNDEIAEIRGSIYTKFRITDTRYPSCGGKDCCRLRMPGNYGGRA